MKKILLFCLIFLFQNKSNGFTKDIYLNPEQSQNTETDNQYMEQYEDQFIEEDLGLNNNNNNFNPFKSVEENNPQNNVIIEKNTQNNGVINKNNTIIDDFIDTKNNTNKNNIFQDVINKQNKKSSIGNFVEKWFIPEQNPAFGENGHSVGIQVAHDVKRYLFPHNDNRELYLFAFQYSGPNKFLGIHGRTSLGLSYFYGQDHWAKEKEKGKYNTPVFEIIQEFVFGNKYLYVTCGVGLSWIVNSTARYELTTEALLSKMQANGIQPIYDTNGNLVNAQDGYGVNEGGYKAAGMTNFNIPITAALGHRFDNGLVIEIMWKHFSNGHVADYNSEVNTVGLSFRYTFGTNKKI